MRAEAQDRMPIDIRDLTCFGRPARLVWIKRRWRCTGPDCDAKPGRALRPTLMPRRPWWPGWPPEIIDRSLRQVTWPEIEAHRERIKGWLGVVTVATIHRAPA